MAVEYSVNVRVNVSTQQLEKLLAIAQRLNENIQRTINISVRVNQQAVADVRNLASALDKLKQNSRITVTVHVAQSINSSLQQLNRLLPALQKLTSNSISINLNTNATTEQIARINTLASSLRELANLRKRTFNFQVNVESNVTTGLIAQLQRLAWTLLMLKRVGTIKAPKLKPSLATEFEYPIGGESGKGTPAAGQSVAAAPPLWSKAKDLFGGVVQVFKNAYSSLTNMFDALRKFINFVGLPFRIFGHFFKLIRAFDSLVSSISQGVHYVSYSLGAIGRAMFFSALTVIYALRRMLNLFNEIEQNLYKATFVFYETGNSFNMLLSTLRIVQVVSARTGLTLRELSETIYYIGAAGFNSIQQATAILEQVSAVGVLTGIKPVELFRSILPVMEAFDMKIADISVLLAKLTKAAAISPVDVTDLITQLPRLASIGDVLQVSIDEALAHIATLAQAGFLPSQIGTALSQLYVDLIKKAPQLAEKGIYVQEYRGGQLMNVPFLDVLKQMLAKAPTEEEQRIFLQGLGFQKRTITALLQLLQNIDKIVDNTNKIANTTPGDINAMKSALEKNIPYRLQRIGAAFERFLTTLIDINRTQILDVLANIEKAIGGLTNWIQKPENTQLLKQIVEHLFGILKSLLVLGFIFIVLSLIFRVLAAIVELLRPMNLLLAGFLVGFAKGFLPVQNLKRPETANDIISMFTNKTTIQLLTEYVKTTYAVGEAFGKLFSNAVGSSKEYLTSKEISLPLKIALAASDIGVAISDAVASFAQNFAEAVKYYSDKNFWAKATPQQKATKKVVDKIVNNIAQIITNALKIAATFTYVLPELIIQVSKAVFKNITNLIKESNFDIVTLIDTILGLTAIGALLTKTGWGLMIGIPILIYLTIKDFVITKAKTDLWQKLENLEKTYGNKLTLVPALVANLASFVGSQPTIGSPTFNEELAKKVFWGFFKYDFNNLSFLHTVGMRLASFITGEYKLKDATKILENFFSSIFVIASKYKPSEEQLATIVAYTLTALLESKKLEESLKKQILSQISTAAYNFSISRSTLPQKAVGGYTGSGTTYEPAGIVHKGEYVIPAWMVRKHPELIALIEQTRLKGFAAGGSVQSDYWKNFAMLTLKSLGTKGVAGAIGDAYDKIVQDIKLEVTKSLDPFQKQLVEAIYNPLVSVLKLLYITPLMSNASSWIKSNFWLDLLERRMLKPIAYAYAAYLKAPEQGKQIWTEAWKEIIFGGVEEMLTNIMPLFINSILNIAENSDLFWEFKAEGGKMLKTSRNEIARLASAYLVEFSRTINQTWRGLFELAIETYAGGRNLYKHFAAGGYTGSGTTYEPAGIVHKGEYVIPAWMVRRYPELIAILEAKRLRGYASGGSVGFDTTLTTVLDILTSVISEMVNSFSGLIENIKEFNNKIDTLKKEIQKFDLQFPTVKGTSQPTQVQSVAPHTGWQKIIDQIATNAAMRGKNVSDKNLLESGLRFTRNLSSTLIQLSKSQNKLIASSANAILQVIDPKILQTLSNAFDFLGNVVTNILDTFANSDSIEAFTNNLNKLISTLNELNQLTGNKELDNAIKSVLAVFSNIAQTVINTASELKGTALGDLLETILGSISGAFQALIPALAQLNSVLALLDPAQVVLQSILDVLTPLINEALAPLVGFFAAIGEILGNMLIPVIKALVPIIRLLAEVLIWLFNKIVLPLAKAIYSIFKGVYDLVKQVYNFLASVFNWAKLGDLPEADEVLREINLDYATYRGNLWGNSGGSTSAGTTSTATTVNYTIDIKVEFNGAVIADENELAEIITQILKEKLVAIGK